MKRIVLWTLCAVFLCGAAAESRADSYEGLWKQVKEYERKDLPKSAYGVVGQIAAKAGKEGKKGQRMAALLYGCKLRQQVVPDSFYTDMLRLERLKRQAADEVERAVLASVIAGLYDSHTLRNRNRSGRTDAHPDSLREWSEAQFRLAASENSRLSMAHPALLAEAKAADYLPFVERGEDASYFNGDLLNVIGRRACWLWNPEDSDEGRLAVCGLMAETYRARGNREAELLVMLDSLEVVSDGDRRYVMAEYDGETAEGERWVLSSSSSYKAYRRMLGRFGDLPLAAEVYIAMVDRLPVTDSLKVSWAEEGYGKYKNYPRAKALLNEKKRLEASSLTLWVLPTMNPDVPFDGVVEHRNVSGMELLWYLLPDGVPEDGPRRAAYQKNHGDYARKYGRLMKTQRLEWPARPAWAEVRDTFLLSCPGVGHYVVVGKPEGTNASVADLSEHFVATRLELVGGTLPDSTSFYTVLDGRTGRPVQGATVEWLSGDRLVHSAVTDADGKARWKEADRWMEKNNRSSLSVRVHKGEDRCHLGATAWLSSPFSEYDGVRETERLYTDRAVYRPGQTVYVGGLCTDERRGEEKAVAGRELTLELRDPNGKTVAEQTVESDGMGTVSATFTLPSTGLSGTYVLRTKNSALTFTVEEYKRPTFEVTLDEPAGRCQAGDTLRLTGVAMNYNGVPLRAARVSATSYVSQWLYRRDAWKEPVRLDTVYTDAEGRFVLSVPVVEVAERKLKGFGFRQVVDVAVLSASGETRTAHTSFPLSKEGMQLSLEGLSSTLVKESLPELEAQVRTTVGAQWKDEVTVTCDIFHAPEGGARKKVVSGIQLPANRKVRVAELSALPSGCYRLALRAVAAEDTAEYAQDFRIFSLSDTRPADGVKDWFYCVNDTVMPGRPGHLKIGSAADSVSLYYMLFCRDRILEEKVVQFSDSLLDFTYPSIPEGADGLQAVFYFMRDGQFYSHSQHVVRKRPDRSLRLSWLTFRDRLQPGTEETWRLRVTMPDGRPAPAQLMSVLYDASLDGIRPHAWQLQRYFTYALPNVSLNKMWWFGGNYMTWTAPFRLATVKGLSFDRFNPDMLSWPGEAFPMVLRSSKVEMLSIADNSGMSRLAAPIGKSAAVGNASVELTADEEQAGLVAAGGSPEEGADSGKPRIAVRGDLRETAFFYPRLMADSAGIVTLRFTLPEGMTTWKFMALAHTKDMYTGTFSDEAVAQKEVMAQLSLPRFVRLGDRTTLSASLFNLTEQPLQGRVTMEVFDPATEKILWSGSMKVNLDAEADSVVSFAYEPEAGVSLPACRVLFEAGEYTDGEQRYLPVLEDKEWLTQTRPFVVSHQGDTLVRLDGLFQDNHREADHRRLTVEYTANPLWYAVQALPSVLQPQTEDVLSIAAAYYASTLSERLAGQYPQMKTAIDAWMQDRGEALKSPLETQEELTGIVLEETPWVADAEAGTRRMMALQQLFDANRQADLRRQFAVSLGKLQREDGAFGWFGGMKGNAYLTRRAARLLLRSGAGQTADATLTSAVDVKKMMRYLMDEAHEDVLKDKEHRAEHKACLYSASYWLETLYLLNLCDASWLEGADRKDADYMLARLTEGMYGLALADKAEAAVVLTRMGRPDDAAQLLASIREHLVDGPEGLHVEYPSNGVVGSDRKMAVHAMLMEALALAGGEDRAEADGLCRWLLSQKRLQDWGTSTATMDAVYALLQGQGRGLTLHTDDEVRLESPKGEEWAVLHTAEDAPAGLGTVTATVEGRELDGGAGILKIVKTEETPSAWGAAYAQFRLPLSEVERTASGLRVHVETDNESPKVGDRLKLRYVITSDRDYEYVRLKAGRAACLEPVEALSGYEYRNGLGYYKEVKDASTNYFFERLPKGTYVLEMECYVERAGRYTVGAAKLNGVYAPEFSAYAPGMTLEVRP